MKMTKTHGLALMGSWVVAVAATAGSFTWVGGASGNWNTLANWESGGAVATAVPTGGDAVDFTNTVEILDAFTVGAGTLAITNSSLACKAIHFNATVSGEGAIEKIGTAALHLHVANTFAGGLSANGTGYNTEGAYIFSDQVADAKTSKVTGWSGEVVIYDGAALGPGLANIGMRSWLGCRLRTVGNLTITSDVILCPDRDNGASGCFWAGGDVVFAGKVSGTSRERFLGDAGVTITMNRSAMTGWFNGYLSGEGAKFVFNGPWENSSYVTFPISAPVFEAHAPLYVGDCRTSSAIFRFFCDEALSNGVYKLTGGGSTVYDLNGHRQTFAALTTFVHPNSANFGFRNSADTPATLVFTKKGVNMLWRGVMDGDINFVWDLADKEFVFSNNVKKLTGSVTVSNGTVAVSRNAGLRGLREIAVRGTAAFRMETGAALCFASTTRLDEGRKLDLAAGTIYCTRALTVGDTTYDSGTYTAANGGAAFILGEGQVIVGALNEWEGSVSADWNDSANWSLKTLPEAGDNVKIDATTSVLLSESTPRLGTVVIGGTLALTNWTTALVADTVLVAGGGKITTVGPFPTNDTTAVARVWVKCGDFTVAQGGQVSVDSLGWDTGYGPGAAYGAGCGAAHMGLGSWHMYSGYGKGTYDDPYQPELPGSGGRYDTIPVPGGGAVRIEATGTVQIDGTVTACGGNTDCQQSYSWKSDCAGAGGSVWISCATFTGIGQVLAEGGKGANPCAPGNFVDRGTSGGGRPGGGGGIRIDYTSLGAVAGMKISAAEGIHTDLKHPRTFANHDEYRTEAEPGTLCFSDTRLVDALLGKGLNGKLVGDCVKNYTYTGDLAFDYGHVRFAETGAAVRVTGNLVVTGAWSRLDLGGFSKRIYTTRPYMDAGDQPISLTVDGDFTLAKNAGFAVYAAATNATDNWGATVNVGGTFEVLSGARVLPTCNFLNMGAPHFVVGSFKLAADATVDADHRGGSGGWSCGEYMPSYGGKYGTRSRGVGVGAGDLYGSAGHGGAGAVCRGTFGDNSFDTAIRYGADTCAGLACDNPYRPCLPGAGGGSGGYGAGGDGGGIFHLTATGAVEVDGTITANGCWSWYYGVGYMDCFGSGAGGTIFLSGETFRGGATARLSARGGDSWRLANESTPYTSGGKRTGGVRIGATGGGGCIAVWTGLPWEAGLDCASSRVLKSAEGAPEKAAVAQSFAGTCDVGGGTNIFYNVTTTDPTNIDSKTLGAAGTTWFCHLRPAAGVAVFLR